jgi:tetratricopeptide (TPR) repeat protein
MNSKLNNEDILNTYFDIYSENTKEARLLLKKLNYKNDSFLLSSIANSYFKEARLRLAERYVLKAFSLDYLNPKVLWVLGLVKWDYGQIDNAIFCFKEIIRIGTRRVSKTGYNETIDIALARINDSKFQLFRLLKDTNPPVAKRYLKDYEKGLKKGIFTIMDFYYNQEKSNFGHHVLSENERAITKV